MINGAITFPQVRLIDAEGQMVGVVSIEEALKSAEEAELDLVCISPNPDNPVCRVMDYNKFLFEKGKREKEAKKKQVIVKVKEVQLSCRIEQHDLDTRVNQAKRFLGEGNKVKAVVRFRGREMSHMDLGREVIAKFEESLRGFGVAEKKPVIDGRFMSIVIAPVKPEKK